MHGQGTEQNADRNLPIAITLKVSLSLDSINTTFYLSFPSLCDSFPIALPSDYQKLELNMPYATREEISPRTVGLMIGDATEPLAMQLEEQREDMEHLQATARIICRDVGKVRSEFVSLFFCFEQFECEPQPHELYIPECSNRPA